MYDLLHFNLCTFFCKFNGQTNELISLDHSQLNDQQILLSTITRNIPSKLSNLIYIDQFLYL